MMVRPTPVCTLGLRRPTGVRDPPEVAQSIGVDVDCAALGQPALTGKEAGKKRRACGTELGVFGDLAALIWEACRRLSSKDARMCRS